MIFSINLTGLVTYQTFKQSRAFALSVSFYYCATPRSFNLFWGSVTCCKTKPRQRKFATLCQKWTQDKLWALVFPMCYTAPNWADYWGLVLVVVSTRVRSLFRPGFTTCVTLRTIKLFWRSITHRENQVAQFVARPTEQASVVAREWSKGNNSVF